MIQDEKIITAILKKHKQLLDSYTYGECIIHDLIYIASTITSACIELEIECPIVVGGLAVETYTSGNYTTCDIDFISDSMVNIHRVMTGLGFTTKEGYRYYCHPIFGDVVEFPTPPLCGSKDRISIIDLPNDGKYYVIGIEDIIINRLEEFVYWDMTDIRSESATQIISMVKAHSERIDFDYLREQASIKGVLEGLGIIIGEMQQY